MRARHIDSAQNFKKLSRIDNHMKIGISSANIGAEGLWMQKLALEGYKLIEVNRRFTLMGFSGSNLKKIAKKAEDLGIGFTLHSAVTDLLHSDPLVHGSQLGILRSEIKYSPLIGCNDIVFHLSDHVSYTKDKAMVDDMLKDLSLFAQAHDVTLYLENDSHGPWSDVTQLKAIFLRHPDIKHVLDLGHLNVAVNHGLTRNHKHHLDQLKDFIDYLHVHGNDGQWDQHLDLFGDESVQFLKRALCLDPSFVIIETHAISDAHKTRSILEHLYQ